MKSESHRSFSHLDLLHLHGLFTLRTQDVLIPSTNMCPGECCPQWAWPGACSGKRSPPMENTQCFPRTRPLSPTSDRQDTWKGTGACCCVVLMGSKLSCCQFLFLSQQLERTKTQAWAVPSSRPPPSGSCSKHSGSCSF